jgi:predicted secreted hydrolase
MMSRAQTLRFSTIILLVALLCACRGPSTADQIDASLVTVPTPASAAGYTRALPGRPLVFPEDHGPHPDYQTEWWYYTGNLADAAGNRFGYQLTFFRRALQPPQEVVQRASRWAADQAYMAHFAITDASLSQHQATEKLARGAAGLAGAQASPFEVWLEDWQVQETAPGVYSVHASADGGAIDLLLRDSQSLVLHGDQGYSQKGPDPGNASYYYSLTDLATTGEIQVGGKTYSVQGSSWMDHEFSTSALSPGQVGWDWFSIQLDDGRQLMFFQLRGADGGIDPYSSGTLVEADGSTRHLAVDDFDIKVEDTWKSPHSGGVYPSRWTVTLPGEGLVLHIAPLVRDQELNLTYNYWEGAVNVEATSQSQAVAGTGYVELTGYAGSMSGEF